MTKTYKQQNRAGKLYKNAAQKIQLTGGKASTTVPAIIDTGDCHFMVRLTDNTGWQALQLYVD